MPARAQMEEHLWNMVSAIRGAERVNSRGWRTVMKQEVLGPLKQKKIPKEEPSVLRRLTNLLRDGRIVSFEPAQVIRKDDAFEGVICFIDDVPGRVFEVVHNPYRGIRDALRTAEERAD